MFGTFEPEGERVRYGLTTNIGTFRPLEVAFGEYTALWHDLKAVSSWRTRAGLLFHGPGWRPQPGEADEPLTQPVKG